jgi:hypothetical protein
VDIIAPRKPPSKEKTSPVLISATNNTAGSKIRPKTSHQQLKKISTHSLNLPLFPAHICNDNHTGEAVSMNALDDGQDNTSISSSLTGTYANNMMDQFFASQMSPELSSGRKRVSRAVTRTQSANKSNSSMRIQSGETPVDKLLTMQSISDLPTERRQQRPVSHPRRASGPQKQPRPQTEAIILHDNRGRTRARYVPNSDYDPSDLDTAGADGDGDDDISKMSMSSGRSGYTSHVSHNSFSSYGNNIGNGASNSTSSGAMRLAHEQKSTPGSHQRRFRFVVDDNPTGRSRSRSRQRDHAFNASYYDDTDGWSGRTDQHSRFSTNVESAPILAEEIFERKEEPFMAKEDDTDVQFHPPGSGEFHGIHSVQDERRRSSERPSSRRFDERHSTENLASSGSKPGMDNRSLSSSFLLIMANILYRYSVVL